MAQNFIGSLISLVSTSDIRYRGILQQIDHANSTIQLEQVYSMGTEDRRPPAEFLPSNPKPYEYIVFRATEVKDLVVERGASELAAAAARRDVHQDPAIVGASTGPAPVPAPVVAPAPAVAPPQQPAVAVAPAPVAAPTAPAQAVQSGYVTPTDASANGAANRAAPPATRSNGQHNQQPPPARPTNASRNSVRSAEVAVESVERAMGDLRIGNTNGNGNGHGDGQHGGSRRGGGRRGGGPGIRGPGIVPDTPFDFSRNNAKFTKPTPAAQQSPLASEDGNPDETSAANTSNAAEPAVKGFYDKSKSFFDDISSDSRLMTEEERMSGARGRRDAERNRNLSTFGETGVGGIGGGVPWGGPGGREYGAFGGQAGAGGRRGGSGGRRRGGVRPREFPLPPG